MKTELTQAEILADIAAWGKGQLSSNTTHNGEQPKEEKITAQDIADWGKRREQGV